MNNSEMIRLKKFRSAISGYNKEDVNQFIKETDLANSQKEQEWNIKLGELEAELNALKTEKRISTYTAKLLEVGFDAQTAASMAMSLPEGISDDFFTQQKTFLDAQKQLAKTEALNNQPGLSVGTPPATPNKEDADIRRWMGLPVK